MSVSAIIVTRGDVDLSPILDALPSNWEIVIWDNGKRKVRWHDRDGNPGFSPDVRDISVYGRYAAIEYASHDLIYVQDDDCVVEDPAYIVDTFMSAPPQAVICNMPLEFRHDFYEDHALVGFGAAFYRDTPLRAFIQYGRAALPSGTDPLTGSDEDRAFFTRTCDIVFTSLTPRVLVDVPKTDLPWASDNNRMWMQPTHQAERSRMLDLCKEVLHART